MLIERTDKTVKSALMRYGKHPKMNPAGKKINNSEKCQGCGKEIRTDGDLSGVQFVVTKRGTGWFFHEKCLPNIWERKIAL